MKTLAVLLCAAYVCFAQGQRAGDNFGEFSASEKACIKKLNLDELTVDLNMKQLYMPEDNVQFSKFMACVWKKDGFIDEKDNLVFSKFKNFIVETFTEVIGSTRITEAFATDSVNSCKTIKGDNAGQRGIKFMNCVTRLFRS